MISLAPLPRAEPEKQRGLITLFYLWERREKKRKGPIQKKGTWKKKANACHRTNRGEYRGKGRLSFSLRTGKRRKKRGGVRGRKKREAEKKDNTATTATAKASTRRHYLFGRGREKKRRTQIRTGKDRRDTSSARHSDEGPLPRRKKGEKKKKKQRIPKKWEKR